MKFFVETFYSSTQIAEAVGVVKNTIINWERKGLLIPHHVSKGGKRFYSQQQLDTLLNRKEEK